MSALKSRSKAGAFVLPDSIVTRSDVARLVMEIERVDNEMIAKTARARVKVKDKSEILLGDQLQAFLAANELSLEKSRERTRIIKELRQLKQDAPGVHMTFAVMADPYSLSEIVTWLRTHAHPQTLLTVGLQPGLVAGAHMRTPNKALDFSLRGALDEHRGDLVKRLEALREG